MDNSTESNRATASRRTFLFEYMEGESEGEPHIVSANILCEKHTKLERYGANAQRIYFVIHPISGNNKVFIGHIGNHLD
ncbi:MAG: hypothetical protein JEZ01_20975 [Labilibaculum sp.]|nr:hypothetical protein [Labilibaculum sp.]MBI9060253.1 hypothetical protein [Labilibaculum sp.]